MLLAGSLVLVLGTVGMILLNLREETGVLRFGYEQMIHARIPWLVLGSLGAGCALGVVSIVRRRAGYKFPVVGLELAVSGLIVWYVSSGSLIPEHQLGVRVGDPFPAYSLPDQAGRIHSVEEGDPRRPALYVFYRGSW